MSAPIATATAFRITPLRAEVFAPLFAMTDEQLAARGARRVVADEKPGFPCRVSLVDAEVGETLVLLHHLHHDVAGPYRASGPIYVREHARTATLAPGEVPALVRERLLSIRAYDDAGTMRGADVIDGRVIEAAITRLFADPAVRELHVHNARPGCYSCRIERA